MKLTSEQIFTVLEACTVLLTVFSGGLAEEDYYKTLGVAQDASDKDIKKAYRKLAALYHPDRNKSEDAQVQFVKVAKAHEVLSDPQKRQNYDQTGNEDQAGPTISFEDLFKGFNNNFKQQRNRGFGQFFKEDTAEDYSYTFGGGHFFDINDMFNSRDSGNFGSSNDHKVKQKTGGFHNSGSCHTVMQKMGNMFTTHTVCS